MTLADPYPTNLEEVDDAALGFAPSTADPVVVVLTRIANALERMSAPPRPQPFQNAPLAALPPVVAQGAGQGVCPIHGVPWKVVPAGVSSRTGNAYEAFRACPTKGCDQRPPR